MVRETFRGWVNILIFWGYMPLKILRKENDQKFIEMASGEHFK